METQNKTIREERGSRANGGAAGRNPDKNDKWIARLRADFKGQVITPADGDYNSARATFYGGIDLHPAAVIRPVDVDEVCQVVTFARETGLPLAVRSGGHSQAGFSVNDGGIVLDLRNLRALHIDTDRQVAWAGPGLTAGEYTSAAADYGLATPFGDTGSVGLGGLTLGGGVGYLVRKHGLTIDSLLSAELVTADGKILEVNAEMYPDLFWAIRGGGGNFGVATLLKYRLHPLNGILGGMLVLPATPAVITGFMAMAYAAPEALSTIANVMTAPPMPFLPPEYHGKLILMAMMVYAGDVEDGQRAVAPFRTLARPIADMLRPMRYPEMFPPEDENYHPTAAGTTLFLDRVDLETASLIVERLETSDAPFRVTQLRSLGGAMARVPADATAFAHRRSRVLANVAAFYTGPEDKPVREAWVESFVSDLRQGDTGAYVNFMGDEGEARVRDAYPGATWERLARIKALYDPANLFRRNQNIPPAHHRNGKVTNK